MSERLSWQQALILDAASYVDSLPFEAQFQISIPYGTWRSLVVRGLLRPSFAKEGWEITPDGISLIRKKLRGTPRAIVVQH